MDIGRNGEDKTSEFFLLMNPLFVEQVVGEWIRQRT